MESHATDELIVGERESSPTLSTTWVITALAAFFLLNLLLRVFYLRYEFVNGDEAVRAITALRLLDGARLYVDIVTDKPPGATLFYAAVFWLFGASMKAVHLVAAVWNFGTALVLYVAGSRFYDRRTGLWAALLFVVFSTTYHTPDMMAANTELLMALPYTLSFFAFVNCRMKERSSSSAGDSASGSLIWMALAGVFTGIAVLFKQVAVLNLLFFVLFEVVSVLTARSSRNPEERGLIASGVFSSVARLAAVFAGFAAVAVVVVIWLASMGALSDFWRSVFEMGGVYIASLPFEAGVRFMVTRTGGFVLFNLALWLLVALAVVKALKATSTEGSQSSRERDNERSAHGIFSVDVSVAIWAAISLGGVFGGGRFFGHYFIQVLPALSLLGSRGVANLRERIGNPSQRALTRVAVAVLVVLFVFAFVRFHQRTAILAYETLSGSKTSLTDAWGMTRREREAEVIVARLKELGGAACPIYVWGYALDIYWLTGCRPASRYLMPYYISGQFPETGTVNPAHSDFWSETRSRFLEDLTRNRPPVILDVEGNLTALPSREILSFIERNYRREAEIGIEPHRPFVVYRLKADPDLAPHLSDYSPLRQSTY